MPDTLSQYFHKHGLDEKILEQLKPLKRWWNRWRRWKFHQLVNPFKVYQIRDDIDQRILFDRYLVPIAVCGNGDFVVVPCDEKIPNVKPAAVYFLCHELADMDNDHLFKVMRLISDSIPDYLKHLNFENCNFATDYFDNNPNKYDPFSGNRPTRDES